MNFFEKYLYIDYVNQKIRDYLGVNASQRCAQDADACFLLGMNGPLWYNGYFYRDGIKINQVNHILEAAKARCIVVGHSKVEELKSLFDNAIIAIDTHTTDKTGHLGEYSHSYCEGLLVEGENFYRISSEGIKEPLN